MHHFGYLIVNPFSLRTVFPLRLSFLDLSLVFLEHRFVLKILNLHFHCSVLIFNVSEFSRCNIIAVFLYIFWYTEGTISDSDYCIVEYESGS